jgi:hypothetical protein
VRLGTAPTSLRRPVACGSRAPYRTAQKLERNRTNRVELANHRAAIADLVDGIKQHIAAARTHSAALDGDVDGELAAPRERLKEIDARGKKIAESDAAWKALEDRRYQY